MASDAFFFLAPLPPLSFRLLVTPSYPAFSVSPWLDVSFFSLDAISSLRSIFRGTRGDDTGHLVFSPPLFSPPPFFRNGLQSPSLSLLCRT